VEPLSTLGLWGDGDEICAIEEAFEVLGLTVPVEDAPNWLTVANLWASVEMVAPLTASKSSNWDKFRVALSRETGVDWTKVEMTTTLIDGRGHNILSRLITTLREKIEKVL
jgi:hypothetical protein